MNHGATNTGHPCIYKSKNGYRLTMNLGPRKDEYSHGLVVKYPKETIGFYKTLDEAIEEYERRKDIMRLERENKKIEKRMSLGLTPYKREKSCKYKGVSYRAKDRRYIACMTVNKKWIYLGSYKTPEEARDAYLAAKRTRDDDAQQRDD